jgi:Zn-dependent protease with chaperone function
LELTCRNCGNRTREELRFCLNCRMTLTPRTRYDLGLSDFAYPPDLSAIETIKVTGPLPYIIKRLALADFEKKLVSRLSTTAHKVTYPSEIDALARECATLLSIEFLPEIFMVDDDTANAMTFGSEQKAYLIINVGLLKLLTRREVMAVIAHELAHIKSGHMMYHTLAEVLGGGINLSASLVGLDVLSIPVRLALLSWHRESEVSADRASMLTVDDIEVIRSLLRKLGSGSESTSSESRRDAGMLETLGELFRTHPIEAKRFKLAEEFWKSREFTRAKQRIQLRLNLLKALVPVCRFCGESKSTEALFCPRCGKCQA